MGRTRGRTGGRGTGTAGPRSLAALVVVVGSGAAAVSAPTPASAYPSATVTFEGHGSAGGNGMGQWGALGYALAGTAYQNILEYYYGGQLGGDAEPDPGGRPGAVAMTEIDGDSIDRDVGVAVQRGRGDGPGRPERREMHAGRWHLDIYVGGGCAGPWPAPTVTGATNPTASPGASVLQLCEGPGNLFLPGTIRGSTTRPGRPRAVNTLPLEQYVADVVPSESPAGWGDLGGPARRARRGASRSSRPKRWP